MKKKFKSTILLTILCVISVITLFAITTNNTKAAWYDDTYAYRVKLSFVHNAALANQSVTYTVDLAELITANILQADCDDIRFTDANGKLLLHDLTSSCNNASATIEVIFANVISGSNVAYMYYDNPTARNVEVNSGLYTALTPSGGDPSSQTNPTAVDEQGVGPNLFIGFEELDGSTANDSIFNNDATLTDTTWTTKDLCQAGGCLSFDGSTSVATVTNASPIDLDSQLAGGFTFQAWIRPNSAGEGTGGQIFYKGTNTWLRVDTLSGGSLDIEASVDLATTDATLNIATAVTEDQWTHVAVSYTDDGDDEITIWVNGKNRGSSTNGVGSLATDTNNLLIGGNTTNNFHGYIDEVKIYPNERTAAQMNSEYSRASTNSGISVQAGASTPAAAISNGLLGYWKLDESSGSAADSSGNNITLTNNGTTTYTGAKFGFGSNHNGTTQYLSTATTMSNVRTISFWVNPASTSDDYIHLASGVYINSSSGTINASGITAANIYVNGVANGLIVASTWNQVIVTSTSSSTANAFEIGRANSAYLNNGGRIDDVRVYNRFFSIKEVQNLYAWSAPPIAYYDFDFGSGSGAYVKDISGNNNADLPLATSPNEASWGVGKFGNALINTHVDGDGATSIDSAGSQLAFTNGTNFTIMGWIYYTGRNAFNDDPNLFGRNDCCGSPAYRVYLNSTDNIVFELIDDSADGNTTYTATTTTTLSMNRWYHIAATFDDADASNINIYVNGVPLTVTKSGTLANIDDFTDSSHINVITGFYNMQGAIDDFKIYKYARTSSQIYEDMNGGHQAVGTPIGSYLAYWNFDDMTGTIAQDKSPNNQDLTLSTAAWTTAGKYNGAWNNTGSNYASYTGFDFLNTDDFSISLWFKSDSATNPGTEVFLLSKGRSAFAGYAFAAQTNGTVCFQLDDDTFLPSSCSSTDIYDATWHHLVGVHNTITDSIYLYVDGKLVDSDTDTTVGVLSGSSTLYVGAGNAGGGNGLSDIDEVKIYDFALTSGDVQLEYNRSSSMSFGSLGTTSAGNVADNSVARSFCPPGDTTSTCAPVGWWKLDEGTGTSVVDSSGNGNSGTITPGTGSHRSGKVGSAFGFDNSSTVINVGSGTTLDDLPSSGMSISTWVYPVSQGEGSAGFIVAKNSGATPSSGWILQMAGTNALTFTVDGSTDLVRTTSNSVLTTNAWNHITVFWDGTITTASSVRVFVNGSEVSYATTTNGASRVSDATSTLYIGNDSTSSRTFDGILDDVKIYNYTRTPAQIAWDYNRGAPVVKYSIDECQGATIYNSVPSANNKVSGIDGTLTPGASGNTSTGACSSGTSTDMWNDGTIGKYNSAIGFDGADDYITTTNTSQIDQNEGLQNGLTIAGWIYANTDGEGDVGRIFTKNTNTWCRVDSQSGSNLDLQCSLDLATDATLNVTGRGLTTGAWNHVAMSWTNDADDEISLWINGKLAGTSTDGVGDASADTANLIIGNDSTSGTATFDGLIDEFQIYNYELSTQQIQLLYNQSSSVRFGPQTGSP